MKECFSGSPGKRAHVVFGFHPGDLLDLCLQYEVGMSWDKRPVVQFFFFEAALFGFRGTPTGEPLRHFGVGPGLRWTEASGWASGPTRLRP